MENKVFVILRDHYEQHHHILSAGELERKMNVKCSSDYLLEGIYLFNYFLDELREG